MIQGLYETHIQVRDLAKSVAFYTEVLGLRVAHRDPTRPIVFFMDWNRQRLYVGPVAGRNKLSTETFCF